MTNNTTKLFPDANKIVYNEYVIHFLFTKEKPMISARSRKILSLLITIVMAVGTAFPAYARASASTGRVIEPFELVDIGCNGEEVFLSGELLLMFHTSFDAGGGIHAKSTLVPLQIHGVGSETGAVYKAVGGDRSHFNIDADFAPYIFTETSMYNLVSQGGSGNLQLKFTFHVIINANGVETVTVDHFSTRCVG